MREKDLIELKRAGRIAKYRILLTDDDGEIIEMSVQPALARNARWITPRMEANMREIVQHSWNSGLLDQ